MSSNFELQKFLPFQLARLSHEISNRLSQIYSAKFDIDIPEWRVLATIADKKSCTAQSVVASTRTHKSTISRAVSRLIDNDWIERVSSNDDRRKILLRLTVNGQSRMNELVPLVLEFEKQLYSNLSDQVVAQTLNGISELEETLGLAQYSTETC